MIWRRIVRRQWLAQWQQSVTLLGFHLHHEEATEGEKRHLSYLPSHMTSIAPYQHVGECREKNSSSTFMGLFSFAASTTVPSDCGYGREPNPPWKREAECWSLFSAKRQAHGVGAQDEAASKTTANWACLVRHHLPIISSLLRAAETVDVGRWGEVSGRWQCQPAGLPT